MVKVLRITTIAIGLLIVCFLVFSVAFGIGEDENKIKAWARDLVSLFPEELYDPLQADDVQAWQDESYNLAVTVAYADIQSETMPSPEYLDRCRQVSLKRLALAGCRLAAVLNDALQ